MIRRACFGGAALAFLAASFTGCAAAADETSAGKSEAKPVATVAPPGSLESDAPWSESVKGLRARVVLRHKHVFNGTPMLAVYLQLQNTADLLSPMKISFSKAQTKYRVVNAAANDLPFEGVAYDGPLPQKPDLILPRTGTLSFDISGGGAGVPGDLAAMIDLGIDGCFMVKPGQDSWFLHVVLEIDDAKKIEPAAADPGEVHMVAWQGRIELPPVRIPMTVDQPDPAKVGAMIEKLGKKMAFGKGRVSEQAQKALSLIADERVIPWYVKAMDTHDYELKYAALDRLSRFKGDAAFGALKKGLDTTAADFPDVAPAVAAGTVTNIRLCAATALAGSSHPDALPLLLTKWNDPDQGVQTTVLHALGKLKTDESLQLLNKMSESPDMVIRDEALRYLKLRGAEPAVKTDDSKKDP